MSTYISGPRTNFPGVALPEFDAEASRLRAEGQTVWNPGELELPEGSRWADYQRICLSYMLSCNAIHMLPGWEASKWARLEHHVATELGFPVTLAPAVNGRQADLLIGGEA